MTKPTKDSLRRARKALDSSEDFDEVEVIALAIDAAVSDAVRGMFVVHSGESGLHCLALEGWKGRIVVGSLGADPDDVARDVDWLVTAVQAARDREGT